MRLNYQREYWIADKVLLNDVGRIIPTETTLLGKKSLHNRTRRSNESIKQMHWQLQHQMKSRARTTMLLFPGISDSRDP